MITYAKIENGQLITAYNGYNGITGFADNIDLMTANGFKPYEEDSSGLNLVDKYLAGMAIIQKNKLVDITDTDEYKAKIAEQEKETKIADLNNQIETIDKKRIRAMCEPSVKDDKTGQTWLEYYTNQILDLRGQIAKL